jgi:hypothetical protein
MHFFLRQNALQRPMGFYAASEVPDHSSCIMPNATTPPFFRRYTVNEKYRSALTHNNHTIYT